MRLVDYLSETKTSVSDFARQIGKPQSTVFRYANGQRIPERAVMEQIFDITGGKVAPNDFYGMTPSEPERATP